MPLFRYLPLLAALGLCLPVSAKTPPAPTQPTSVTTAAKAAAQPKPQVLVKTSLGSFIITLFPDKAPKTVANFLAYVKSGFYAGTVFQRVIKGFLIQGGQFTTALVPKPTRPPIPIEANNGLSNLRGTIAAARASDPNSETSQFFINLVDNPRLDFVNNQSGQTWGYAVFGKVVKGMNIVDKIGSLPTGPQGPFSADVPSPLPVIESMALLPTSHTATGKPAPPGSTRP